MFFVFLFLAPSAFARRWRRGRHRHVVNDDPVLNQPFPLKANANAAAAPQPLQPPPPLPQQPLPQMQRQQQPATIQQRPQQIVYIPVQQPVGFNYNMRGYLGAQPQMVIPPQYVPIQPPPNYYRVVPMQRPVHPTANQMGRGILDDQAVFDELLGESMAPIHGFNARYDDLLDDGTEVGIDDFNSMATNGERRRRRRRHRRSRMRH